MTFDRVVDQTKTLTVSPNLHNLVSKVARLSNPSHPKFSEYDELCKKVLGFSISEHPALGGQQAGIPIGNFDYIPIEAMGEGVSSLLGLITDLCMANKNLFLIEELENDIHPEGLKAILDVIVEKSADSQFIVSTHSNIVAKYLGAAPGSRIFNVSLDYEPGTVPTSHIEQVENTAAARIQVLRGLGYELYDFDLWEGWLILEESSAEVLIRDYLIPWFAPKMSRVRTIGAGGTSKVGPTFEDFRRLFLFAHLEPQYERRAWVVADGDESGQNIIRHLRDKYSSWPADHFRTWSERDIERYYPERFEEAGHSALNRKGDEKRTAKKELLDEVREWCDEHPDDAKLEFQKSAAEIIGVLRDIERSL
ncbi:MAG TPA: AAA family ATPase [Streptosporangiaceae bacterium]|nr:AAA family ATPase [Streptosporangiaceae bacterium]